MADPPRGRKWNLDPNTKSYYYYSKSEGAYIYQSGRKVYCHLRGRRGVASQLDQDPPLPPPPQQTILLVCRKKYRICSPAFLRQLAIKEVGPEAEYLPLEVHYMDDRVSRFISGRQRERYKDQCNIPKKPKTAHNGINMHYAGIKPIANSWAEFLNDNIAKPETSGESSKIQEHIPYSTMTLQQKIQRANLALCYSLFKAKTSPASNQKDSSQSNQANQAKQKNHGANSSSSKRFGQATSRKRNRSRNSGRNKGNKNDDEENESSEDEHYNKRINRSFGDPNSSQNCRFACPYFQKDSERFRKTSCNHNGWPSISRLKQHLYRNHALPPLECQPCIATFNSLDDMMRHSLGVNGCKVQSFTHLDGFDPQQKQQLKRRKCPEAKEDEDKDEAKWRHIFMILFPDSTEIPSPYHPEDNDNSDQNITIKAEVFEEFKNFMKNPPHEQVLKDLAKASQEISIPDVDSFNMKEAFDKGNLCLQLFAGSQEQKQKARHDSLIGFNPELLDPNMNNEVDDEFMDEYLLKEYLDDGPWEPTEANGPSNSNNFTFHDSSHGNESSWLPLRSYNYTGIPGQLERNPGNTFGAYHGIAMRGAWTHGPVSNLDTPDNSREIHTVDIEDCFIFRPRNESGPMSPSVAAP